MNDYKYMLMALEEAKKAYSEDEIPIGAVIVRENEVLSSAHNRKEKTQLPIAHAEILAIIEACAKSKNWRLNNATMYVTLEPCPMCASAIKQSRISKVVYLLDSNSFVNKKITNEILVGEDANIPVEIVKYDDISFDKDDLKLISSFFENKRH